MTDDVHRQPPSELLLLCDTFAYLDNPGRRVKVNLHPGRLRFFVATAGGQLASAEGQFGAEPHRVLSLDDLAGSAICKSPRDPTNAFLTLYVYPREKKRTASETTTSTAASGRVTTLGNSRRKRVSVTLVCDAYKDLKQNLAKVNEWHVKLDLLLKRDPVELYDDCIGLQVRQGQLARVLSGRVEERQIDAAATAEAAGGQLLANRNRRPYLVLINPNSGAGKAKLVFYEHVVPVWSEANVNYVVLLTTHANHAREYMLTADLDAYRGILVVSGDGLVYEVINGLMSRPDWRRAVQTPVNQLPGGSANALACCTAHVAKELFHDVPIERFAATMAFFYSKAESAPMDLVALQLCTGELVHSFLTLEWAFIADVDLESEKFRYLGGARFTVGALVRLLNLRTYRGRVSFLPADGCEDYKPKDPTTLVVRSDGAGSRPMAPTQLGHEFACLAEPDAPVPAGWLSIEASFVFLLISNLPLIASDFLSAPHATFNDGALHLVFIKEGVSKLGLVKLLLSTSTDEYLEMPFVEHVRVKAFRLEPLDASGTIMIDGEQVPYGRTQGEIKPSLGRTLAWPASNSP